MRFNAPVFVGFAVLFFLGWPVLRIRREPGLGVSDRRFVRILRLVGLEIPVPADLHGPDRLFRGPGDGAISESKEAIPDSVALRQRRLAGGFQIRRIRAEQFELRAWGRGSALQISRVEFDFARGNKLLHVRIAQLHRGCLQGPLQIPPTISSSFLPSCRCSAPGCRTSDPSG